MATLDVTVGTDESLQGNVKQIYNSYSAYTMRKTIQSIGQEGYLATLKQLHGNWEYTNLKIENLDSIDMPLIIKYEFKTNDAAQQSSDLCIINPVLFFSHNENPFSSIERKFPIDFGCAENEIYTLNFTIPKGYIIDETPENINLKLPNDAAVFVYKTEQNAKQVTIMYRYNRKQTYFDPEAYSALREFFNKMIKKQSELIILKKLENPVANN
jgi:hypothetical protein